MIQKDEEAIDACRQVSLKAEALRWLRILKASDEDLQKAREELREALEVARQKMGLDS